MTIQLAPDLSLPLDAVTETFAILAKRGAGKTYTAAVFTEQMIGAGLPVVVIDPIGVWWGLRSSADAKSDGLPVAIFGGDHADVPLDEHSGAIIADAIIAERFPAIIDLSHLSKGASRRFMTAFIERLYHLNRDAMHVVVDEADAFAPQRGGTGDAARLLGAMEDLVRRGRARGIGCTLITQRPAVLHKDVLTQAEVLICLRMNGVRDVAAIDEWVRLHADEDEATGLKKSLPSLPVGTAWIWSPGWLGILQRVKISKRTTFDSSSTPTVGEKRVVPKAMADIDLEALGEQIAAAADDAKANDPKHLKAENARLRRELDQTQDQPAPEPVVEKVEVPVLSEEFVSRLEVLYDKLQVAITEWAEEMRASSDLIDTVIEQTNTLRAALRHADRPAPKPVTASRRAEPAPGAVVPRADGVATAGSAPPSPGRSSSLPKAQRLILGTLVQNGALTQVQVALLTGYSSKSGSFRNGIGALRSAGFVEGGRDRLEATPDGCAAAGDVPPLPTGHALLDHWRGHLGKAERAIFDVLIDAWPEHLSADQIAERTDYSATSGSFRNALGRLRTLQLASGARDAMVLADELGEAAQC